jgi:hypothetical protein
MVSINGSYRLNRPPNLQRCGTYEQRRPIYTYIIRGNVLGLDLYVDHQMVATTIDDSAFIVAPEAMTVYRSPQAYMSVNVVSNLQVQVAIYGFMATIVKMPKGLVRYNLT